MSAVAAPSSIASSSRAGAIVRAVIGLLAGLAFAGAAAWWFGVKPADAVANVAGVSPWVILGLVASSFVVLAFQSLRWHSVMGPLLGLAYAQAYRAQVVGVMFNALLPARGGDLLRVQYLGRRSGKSRATILGTEVVDRWLDWWGWFPVLGVLALTSEVPFWLYEALGIFGLLLGTMGGVMFFLSRRGYEPRPGSKLGGTYLAFRTGVEAFRSKRMLVLALAVAPLPWLWEVFAIQLSARGFGIDLTTAMAFSVLIGFNVAMVVPSPGSVGSVETGGTAALMFFGVDQSRALAFMFVYHFTQLLPGIATGAAVLVAEGEKLFGRAEESEEGETAAATNEAPIALGTPD